jgi:hypothetical protein
VLKVPDGTPTALAEGKSILTVSPPALNPFMVCA